MDPWWAVLRNCTLLGSLNPAILRPDWLIKQKILPDLQVRETIQLRPDSAVAFETSLVAWSADLHRLVVESISADADPGQFVAKIMRRLEHTPVNAVGNNLAYDCAEERGASVWDERYEANIPQEISAGLLEHQFTHIFEHEGAIVQLKQTVKAGAIRSANFNFHRTVSTAQDAVDAASKWQSDREFSESIMATLFGAKNGTG